MLPFKFTLSSIARFCNLVSLKTIHWALQYDEGPLVRAVMTRIEDTTVLSIKCAETELEEDEHDLHNHRSLTMHWRGELAKLLMKKMLLLYVKWRFSPPIIYRCGSQDEDWAAVCWQGTVEGCAATCEGTAEGREGETSREETPIFVSVSLKWSHLTIPV